MERRFELYLVEGHPFPPKRAALLERKANGFYQSEIALESGRKLSTLKNQMAAALRTIEDISGQYANHGNWIGILVEIGLMKIREKKEGGV